MQRRFFAGILLILACLSTILGSSPVRVSAQQPTPDPSARLSAPIEGALLFGTVSITGTANGPSQQTYRLDYLSGLDANAQWQPIGKPIAQQVTNNVLGQWDTTTVKDGPYQLRLRVILRNGTVLEDYVRNLRVQNQQPTALPTLPPTLTYTPQPTAGGATATLLIQQPPTATTRPQPSIPPTSIPAATPSVLETQPAILSGDAIQSAICSGAFIAIIGFGIYGVYSIVRARTRRTQE